MMALVSCINQFPCQTPSPTSILSKPSLFPLNSTASIECAAKKPVHRVASISIGEFRKVRSVSRVLAVPDDEWESENDPPAAAGITVLEEEPPPEEPMEVCLLKKQLVGSFYGTNRGLSATSETRAEIIELITKLEAQNPTPAPTEALTLLNGKWILAYTSFPGLFPLLSKGTLPLVKVEEISQTIDSDNFTVQNSVLFSGPYTTTSISTNAKFEVRSPTRVQIKFEEGVIGTPQLTDSIVFPENLEFLGQKIDLTPFKGLITSVQDTASSVAKTISSQPPLKFSLSNRNAESWLLTTYLDHELRISKGDAGSVFVLIKAGSSLLKP